MNYISLNISYLVSKEKISNDAFGRKLNLKRGNISSYIDGKAQPKLETIQKICVNYNLSLDDFINTDLSKTENKQNTLHEPQSYYGNENLLDKIKILEGTITLKDSLLSVQDKYIKKLEEDLERLNGTQKNKSAV